MDIAVMYGATWQANVEKAVQVRAVATHDSLHYSQRTAVGSAVPARVGEGGAGATRLSSARAIYVTSALCAESTGLSVVMSASAAAQRCVAQCRSGGRPSL
jgi:hypothetical protein